MRTTSSKHSDPPLAHHREIVAQMRGVSRYFENQAFIRALTNVSFEVRRGEVFGLLGRDGSGKSTAIRILAGRLSASEGKVRVYGRSPRRHSTKARIGYLPERLTHTRSGFFVGVISLLGALFGGRKRHPQSTVLAPAAAKARLSMLRQILIKHPDLVLLDEPFAGLDAADSATMQALIRTLSRQGRTVILSGSSLSCTKDVCDRLAVLSRGRLEATGTLQELLATRNGLRELADLLPQLTAERVLQLIRQEVGASDPPAKTPPETLQAPALGANTEAAPATPDNKTVPEAVLAPMVKAAASDSSSAAESGPTVDHEMLAALTRKERTGRFVSLPESPTMPDNRKAASGLGADDVEGSCSQP
jgi:ABC-2 type transport system ATP-binding protein